MKWYFEFLNFLIISDGISVFFGISILKDGFLLVPFFPFLSGPEITPGKILVSRHKTEYKRKKIIFFFIFRQIISTKRIIESFYYDTPSIVNNASSKIYITIKISC